jgi:hypothetical protein
MQVQHDQIGHFLMREIQPELAAGGGDDFYSGSFA